jgi:hypothetical protein
MYCIIILRMKVLVKLFIREDFLSVLSFLHTPEMGELKIMSIYKSHNNVSKTKSMYSQFFKTIKYYDQQRCERHRYFIANI